MAELAEGLQWIDIDVDMLPDPGGQADPQLDDLADALAQLSYRQRRVLELRHGLGGEYERTTHEICRTFNLMPREVRMVESLAMNNLRVLLRGFHKRPND